MPSKGVQIYSYNALPGAEIELSVPGQSIKITDVRNFRKDRLEIDSKNVKGRFNYTGTFQFRVSYNGREISKEFVNVNTLTGNLEAGQYLIFHDCDGC